MKFYNYLSTKKSANNIPKQENNLKELGLN